MQARLISKTVVDKDYLLELMKEAKEGDEDFITNVQSSEALMAYIARVSSADQKNAKYKRLLQYCSEHGHWSVFEMADATVEIECPLPIATQILRHRSFTFQQLSRRYSSEGVDFAKIKPRRQDTKNRQNSIDDLDEDTVAWWQDALVQTQSLGEVLYREAIKKGIAKETSRFLLPESTNTRLYMKGSIRSWIHYLKVRTDPSTQKEHRDVALAIQEQLKKAFPVIAEVVGW
jgi:thymidylate synthase (FAD)